MRLLVILLFVFVSSICSFAENFAEVFTKGYQFYVRGDYPSAKEMFKHIPAEQGELYAQANFYLGSIAGYEGNAKAEDFFKEAMQFAKTSQTWQMAFNQFSRYCIANSKFKEIVSIFSQEKEKSVWANSENIFYLGYAFYSLGDKQQAQRQFEMMFTKWFADKNEIGCDVFLDYCLSNEDFKKSQAFVVQLKPSNTVAQVRLEVFNGQAITQKQSDISFFCQIILAEQSPKVIDKKMLLAEVYKNWNAPFAWQASLVLGKIFYNEKNYNKAVECAKDCLKLSSPEIMSQKQGLMLLADTYRAMKNYKLALETYEKIYMNRKARGEALAESIYKTGLCYFEQGEWADAHVCFERVFVAFFRYEYWGSRAYYYDAQALYTLGHRRDAHATLLEYFRRAKDRNSPIYKAAKKYYDEI